MYENFANNFFYVVYESDAECDGAGAGWCTYQDMLDKGFTPVSETFCANTVRYKTYTDHITAPHVTRTFGAGNGYTTIQGSPYDGYPHFSPGCLGYYGNGQMNWHIATDTNKKFRKYGTFWHFTAPPSSSPTTSPSLAPTTATPTLAPVDPTPAPTFAAFNGLTLPAAEWVDYVNENAADNFFYVVYETHAECYASGGWCTYQDMLNKGFVPVTETYFDYTVRY